MQIRPAQPVTVLLLVSFGCLLAQVALTDYSTRPGQAWVLLGAAWLWFVYRHRSRVARALIIVTSLTGVVICTIAALHRWQMLGLAALFAGQAVPLMLAPVRAHTSQGSPSAEAHRHAVTSPSS